MVVARARPAQAADKLNEWASENFSGMATAKAAFLAGGNAKIKSKRETKQGQITKMKRVLNRAAVELEKRHEEAESGMIRAFAKKIMKDLRPMDAKEVASRRAEKVRGMLETHRYAGTSRKQRSWEKVFNDFDSNGDGL